MHYFNPGLVVFCSSSGRLSTEFTLIIGFILDAPEPAIKLSKLFQIGSSSVVQAKTNLCMHFDPWAPSQCLQYQEVKDLAEECSCAPRERQRAMENWTRVRQSSRLPFCSNLRLRRTLVLFFKHLSLSFSVINSCSDFSNNSIDSSSPSRLKPSVKFFLFSVVTWPGT